MNNKEARREQFEERLRIFKQCDHKQDDYGHCNECDCWVIWDGSACIFSDLDHDCASEPQFCVFYRQFPDLGILPGCPDECAPNPIGYCMNCGAYCPSLDETA